jgi:trk system potassium uptake protein TrkA
MYIVVGGAGDAGIYLGKLLREGGSEVAFVERDPTAAANAGQVDALVVEGDVSDPRSLRQAEIERADYYVSVVTGDSANLLSCALANYHGCQTVARINSPTLAGEPYSTRFAHIGVDVALCPALIAASQLSRVFAFPSKIRYVHDWGISTYHCVVEQGSLCCDSPEGGQGLPDGARIVSVFRGVEQLLPTDLFRLQPEDELLVFADQRARPVDIESSLGVRLQKSREVRDVFIAGITDAGLTLAERLLGAGISVTLMSILREKLAESAERLNGASAIHADPLGRGVLKREAIDDFDVVMAMGPNMERNILTGVLAKQSGVPTVLSLVDRIDLKDSVEKTLVDDAIVPNLLLVNTIMNLIAGEGPLRRRSLQARDILASEIKVSGKVRCIGKRVGDFTPTIGDFLISAVLSEGRGIVPRDDYVISENDRLLVLYPSRGYDTVKRWLVG